LALIMVVDTSALLAIFFAEPFGDWAAARLAEHAGDLCMSTVNLTETLIRVRDRQPQSFEQIETENLPILAVDRDFRSSDRPVVWPEIGKES
jgi:uncharacterized protein with PIN domain